MRRLVSIVSNTIKYIQIVGARSCAVSSQRALHAAMARDQENSGGKSGTKPPS